MQDLLSQLRDIRGLDAISLWPLAPGWWGILALLLLLASGMFLIDRRRRKIAASWQAKTRAMFEDIRTNNNAKEKAAALSEILRRIAIHKYGRDECAGLEGQKWLQFLTKVDPGNFDWMRDGKLLLEAPYAPDGSVKEQDVNKLVDAAERWVK